MVLINKADRRKLYEYLLSEGVLVVKKDPVLKKHHELNIQNLHVMMICKSLKSRNLVTLEFNWRWYYYTLTNEGIKYLQNFLGVSPEVVPHTLQKPKPKPGQAGQVRSGPRTGGGRGAGRGRGRGAAPEKEEGEGWGGDAQPEAQQGGWEQAGAPAQQQQSTAWTQEQQPPKEAENEGWGNENKDESGW